MDFLIQNFQNSIAAFWNIWGQEGCLCLCAILFLFCASKDKLEKFYCVTFFLLLAIMLNPIFAYVAEKVFLRSTYWRIFWLLPVYAILSFSALKLVQILSDKNKKIIFGAIVIVILIAQSRKPLWDYIQIPENFYKLSSETIEVADLILAENEAPKVVVEDKLLTEIRQYTSKIDLLYGRNIDPSFMGGCWMFDYHSIHDILSEKEPEYYQLYALLVRYEVDYIVIEKEKTLSEGEMGNIGFLLVGETELYNIYEI